MQNILSIPNLLNHIVSQQYLLSVGVLVSGQELT